MTAQEKKQAWIIGLAFAVLIAACVSVAMLAFKPSAKKDNRLYIVQHAGQNYGSYGKPKVSGNTCTFIDMGSGNEMTVSGVFTVALHDSETSLKTRR